jgi:hypothetical protein
LGGSIGLTRRNASSVRLGDLILSDFHHLTQSLAQVEVHLRHQFGHSVAERELPLRRELLAPVQLGHRPLLPLLW